MSFISDYTSLKPEFSDVSRKALWSSCFSGNSSGGGEPIVHQKHGCWKNGRNKTYQSLIRKPIESSCNPLAKRAETCHIYIISMFSSLVSSLQGNYAARNHVSRCGNKLIEPPILFRDSYVICFSFPHVEIFWSLFGGRTVRLPFGKLTNRYEKIIIFPGKYHQNTGFSSQLC